MVAAAILNKKASEGQHPLTGQRAANSGYWPTSEPNAG